MGQRVTVAVRGANYVVKIPGHGTVLVRDSSGKAVESRALSAARWAFTRCTATVSSKKARQILHDKSVMGRPLTEKQRKFFGARSRGANPGSCEGCGKTLHPVGDAGYSVCMDCTKARHKSVLARGRCVCGKRARPSGPYTQAGRSWMGCDRCLGKIKGTERGNPDSRGWASGHYIGYTHAKDPKAYGLRTSPVFQTDWDLQGWINKHWGGRGAKAYHEEPSRGCKKCAEIRRKDNPTSRRGDVHRAASKLRDMRVGAQLRARGLPSGTFGNPGEKLYVFPQGTGEKPFLLPLSLREILEEKGILPERLNHVQLWKYYQGWVEAAHRKHFPKGNPGRAARCNGCQYDVPVSGGRMARHSNPMTGKECRSNPSRAHRAGQITAQGARAVGRGARAVGRGVGDFWSGLRSNPLGPRSCYYCRATLPAGASSCPRCSAEQENPLNHLEVKAIKLQSSSYIDRKGRSEFEQGFGEGMQRVAKDYAENPGLLQAMPRSSTGQTRTADGLVSDVLQEGPLIMHPALKHPITFAWFLAEVSDLWAQAGLSGAPRVELSDDLSRAHARDARRYAETERGDPPIMRFAPETLWLPERNRLGLIAHEIGHVIAWEKLGPWHSEDQADLAARLAGVRVGYDRRWPGKGLQSAC